MFLHANNLDIHVQIDGPKGAAPLLLVHSLGTSLHVWDEQAAALSRSFRVIRADLRGHGLTTLVPGPGSIAQYAQDMLAVRRQVLGEAHVDRAVANTTSFDEAFQHFITRTAWGGVWTRPGLDRRTRSLLTIALMAALGHHEELKLHVRASRNTGATPEDVAEVLIQVAAYAGIPAANAAVRVAKEIFGEMG